MNGYQKYVHVYISTTIDIFCELNVIVLLRASIQKAKLIELFCHYVMVFISTTVISLAILWADKN